MIQTIFDVKKTSCGPWKNGMGQDSGKVLAIEDGGNGIIAVAISSWHVDFAYITWPAQEDHYDEWLATCGYGDYPPSANKLRSCVAEWLSDADLSPLDDNDDTVGQKALANSLLAAIITTQKKIKEVA